MTLAIQSIQSPCVGICSIHKEYLVCQGCLRSRLEIIKWNTGTDEDRVAILKSVEMKKLIYKDTNLNLPVEV